MTPTSPTHRDVLVAWLRMCHTVLLLRASWALIASAAFVHDVAVGLAERVPGAHPPLRMARDAPSTTTRPVARCQHCDRAALQDMDTCLYHDGMSRPGWPLLPPGGPWAPLEDGHQAAGTCPATGRDCECWTDRCDPRVRSAEPPAERHLSIAVSDEMAPAPKWPELLFTDKETSPE